MHYLWRTGRGPILVILSAILGVGAAFVLDEVFHSEWSLTVGGLSLGIVLPAGVIWLLLGSSVSQ